MGRSSVPSRWSWRSGLRGRTAAPPADVPRSPGTQAWAGSYKWFLELILRILMESCKIQLIKQFPDFLQLLLLKLYKHEMGQHSWLEWFTKWLLLGNLLKQSSLSYWWQESLLHRRPLRRYGLFKTIRDGIGEVFVAGMPDRLPAQVRRVTDAPSDGHNM